MKSILWCTAALLALNISGLLYIIQQNQVVKTQHEFKCESMALELHEDGTDIYYQMIEECKVDPNYFTPMLPEQDHD